ncbi:MAG: DciA family protein [Actinomycetota bacterium]|nr:DciA family protein [Actinomycetota bacterium]
MRDARLGRDSPELHGLGQSLRILAKFLDKDGSLELESLRQSWGTAVGEPLASQTWPLRIEGQRLRVAAATPAARAALAIASGKILGELRKMGFGFNELGAEVRSAARRR